MSGAGQRSTFTDGGDGGRFERRAAAGLAAEAASPGGPAGADVLAARYERSFAHDGLTTIGIEEELILAEPGSFEPVDEVEWVLGLLRDPRFVAEFRLAQIELVTPVCLTVPDLRRELGNARVELVEALAGRLRPLAVGTHPVTTRPSGITGRPRYQRIARDCPWATLRGLPSGLHVHVAVDGAADALAVYNAARSYLPELAALGANSPFFEGRDTGLSSSRLKLTEDQPRSGVPPAFASWREIAEFVSWGEHGGLFPDPSFLWWDLRLRPEYGTIEFRVTDTQTSLDQIAAIAAICQALVAALRARHRAGDRLPVHSSHVLAENRWRALRDGLDGELVDPQTGEAEPVRERLARLLLELEPWAAELGCSDELAHAWPLLAGNGACRQREIASERGLDGLLEWLAEETERPALQAHAAHA